jgi:hypothetical protein
MGFGHNCRREIKRHYGVGSAGMGSQRHEQARYIRYSVIKQEVVMKKPTLRLDAPEAEAARDLIDVLCWLYAERAEKALGIPPEEGADYIKQLVLSGRFLIDHRPSDGALRLIPAPSQATQ